ncbi:Zinc finger protein [Nymphaea thermarum]|nr:Zinc finger protein [Nymphaea thermarum]
MIENRGKLKTEEKTETKQRNRDKTEENRENREADPFFISLDASLSLLHPSPSCGYRGAPPAPGTNGSTFRRTSSIRLRPILAALGQKEEAISHLNALGPKTDAGATDVLSKQGPYECKTCGRCFRSFQALGGHRRSHKKAKDGEEKEKQQGK